MCCSSSARVASYLAAFLRMVARAGASCSPLLVYPVHHDPRLPAAAITVMLAGILLQVAAKLALARSVGIVPANRGIKTSGPYRFLRHPMYAGYLLTHIGFLTLNPSWWNLAAYALCYALQIPPAGRRTLTQAGSVLPRVLRVGHLPDDPRPVLSHAQRPGMGRS